MKTIVFAVLSFIICWMPGNCAPSTTINNPKNSSFAPLPEIPIVKAYYGVITKADMFGLPLESSMAIQDGMHIMKDEDFLSFKSRLFMDPSSILDKRIRNTTKALVDATFDFSNTTITIAFAPSLQFSCDILSVVIVGGNAIANFIIYERHYYSLTEETENLQPFVAVVTKSLDNEIKINLLRDKSREVFVSSKNKTPRIFK